jgi:SAM-dependent MidA family methyltransferase
MYQTTDLPEPSLDAIENSLKLVETIKNKIKSEVKIDFATYMHDVLYTPEFGYYTGGSHKLGEQGDFITAPECSSLFSETLANQLAQLIKKIPNAVIFEAGAGSGLMAAHILKVLNRKNLLPKQYWILEPSPQLQAKQLDQIQHLCPELTHHVKWLSEPPTEKFNGVIIANEVIDALPIHTIKLSNKGITELGVKLDAHEHRFTWCELDTINPKADEFIINNEILSNILNYYTKEDDSEFYENINKDQPFYIEVNCLLENWLQDITQNLDQGAAIFLDYGDTEKNCYAPNKAEGSLRCFYQHRMHNDPFVYPGLQDITSDVNFTQLALCAQKLGFEVSGYTTQAMFLASLGLTEKLEQQMSNLSSSEQLQLNNQAKTLLSPLEMGERIKVMSLTKNLEFDLVGYKLNNSVSML